MLLYQLRPRPAQTLRQPDRVQQAQVVPIFRSLNPQERAIAQWLLEHADPTGSHFIHQLDAARVTGLCECGCPTVSLHVGQEVISAFSRRNLIATAIGRVDGGWLRLMLMQSKGYLTCLNVHGLDVIEQSFSLPSLESLRPYWRL
jgi:hypothetical protein